jgi:8-oxo-dGTP pyrophosphatase MutT (NUDIX family)
MKEKSYGVVPYIINADGTSIMVSKSSKKSDYGFVKGKIDKGETKRECAVREAFEEIGVEISIDDLENSFSQKNPKKDVRVYLVNWEKYKDSEIKLAEDELFCVEWFNIEQLPTIVKNQRLIITDLFVKFKRLDFWLKQNLKGSTYGNI